MRIFVTGHMGYIGVHLVEILKASGHSVTGCDVGLFEGCEWEEFVRPDVELKRDIRDLTEADLEGHDCVMHLAALSNDPMGEVDPGITLSINLEGSVRLAKVAKAAGVPRYLFSGSCSVYGKGDKMDLEEFDPLHPLTAYARSKIETETRVGAMADESFCPAFLRNATAYGHSPTLRIDLVVNNLLACALATGRIDIMSDGTPWRPLVHCKDIARAFHAFAEAPREAIFNRAVNIGANEENFQVKDVADVVQNLVPDAKIRFTGEVGNDPRSYRVKFDLLNRLLPDFKLEYSMKSGAEELFRKYKEHGFSRADFEGDRFIRLKILRGRMDRIGVTGGRA